GPLVRSVSVDGALRHGGQDGSGISTGTRRELLTSRRAIERPSPPIDPAPRLPRVHWVEPRIVIRAEFAEWTRDGLVRQAAFKGVEIGKDASAVVREDAGPVRKVLGDGRRPAPAEAAGDGAESRATPAAEGGEARRGKRAPRNAAPPSGDEGAAAASPEELAALDTMDK